MSPLEPAGPVRGARRLAAPVDASGQGVRPDRRGNRGSPPGLALASRAHATRLETRTKEANAAASQWVENLNGDSESDP
jgi:hypothetical protein